MRKWIFLYTIFIICALVIPAGIAWSFINLPLTDDVRVFIGNANQASLTVQPFPINIDTAWELKPLGNRALWYSLTKIQELISTIVGGTCSIQIISLIAAAFISALLMIQLIRKMKGNPDLVFVVLVLALIAPFNLYLMQAEWWAVLISYLILMLLLEETPTSMAIAGIISIFLAFIKLSTILLIPTIFITYLLIAGYSRKEMFRNTIPFLAGLATGSLLALSWLVYLPNAIPDMLFSMNVAHASRGVSMSFFDSIIYLIYYGFEQILSFPILAAGVVSGLVVTCICIMMWINAKEDRGEATIHTGLFILLWLFPIASILIQGEFFDYHYMILALPCVVSIILLGNLISDTSRGALYFVVIISITAFWILHCSIWSDNYPSQEAFWNKIDSDASLLEEKYHMDDQPSILYLTTADAPYWFDSPSACRQVGSLPIMYNMTDTQEYADTLSCIEKYQGEYIIALHETGSTLPVMNGAKIAAGMPGKYLPNYTKIENMTVWDVYRMNT